MVRNEQIHYRCEKTEETPLNTVDNESLRSGQDRQKRKTEWSCTQPLHCVEQVFGPNPMD